MKKLIRSAPTFIALGLSLASQYSLAQLTQEEAPRMKVFSEVAGAEDIVAGRYKTAIKKITAAKGTNAMLKFNNLCVAHTLSGHWEQAHTNCERALKETRRRQNYGATWLEQTGSPRVKLVHQDIAQSHLEILAAAYSEATNSEIAHD